MSYCSRVGVPIMSVKRRGFLRQMAEKAKQSTSTLKETLVAAQSGHFVSTFQRGRLVVSQSGSGQSGSFEMTFSGKEWTQDNVFGLVEELIELLEFTLSGQSMTDDGTTAATDALMTAMMQDQSMQSSSVQYGDFTLIGVPNAFGSR